MLKNMLGVICLSLSPVPGLVMCSTAIMAPNLKYHQRQVPLAPLLYVTC